MCKSCVSSPTSSDEISGTNGDASVLESLHCFCDDSSAGCVASFDGNGEERPDVVGREPDPGFSLSVFFGDGFDPWVVVDSVGLLRCGSGVERGIQANGFSGGFSLGCFCPELVAVCGNPIDVKPFDAHRPEATVAGGV